MKNRDESRWPRRVGRTARRRPSHSTVVAYVALFLALGGGSFAVAALSGKDKKIVKKLAKKQANTQITKRAPGLSVASAQSATNAQNAASAQQAQNATTAGDAGTLGGLPASALLPAGAVIRIPPTELADNDQINPVDMGGIDLTFGCLIDNVGQDVFNTSIVFQNAGSVVYGSVNDPNTGGVGFFSFQQAHSGSPSIDQQTVTIAAEDGPSLTGVIWNAFNLHGTTDRCFIGGHLVVAD